MRALASVKRRVAIVAAVAAIGIVASACFPDITPGVGPSDPLKAQILNAMNADRAGNGVPPLTYSPKLDNLAGTWAWDMAMNRGFTHQNLSAVLYSPDFAAWYTLGENILVGPGNTSAAQMESSWMNSASHRANILNRSFNAVGVGYFRAPDGRLWVCVDFGGL
jgi:uncharacterized protein YkwD